MQPFKAISSLRWSGTLERQDFTRLSLRLMLIEMAVVLFTMAFFFGILFAAGFMSGQWPQHKALFAGITYVLFALGGVFAGLVILATLYQHMKISCMRLRNVGFPLPLAATLVPVPLSFVIGFAMGFRPETIGVLQWPSLVLTGLMAAINMSLYFTPGQGKAPAKVLPKAPGKLEKAILWLYLAFIALSIAFSFTQFL